MTSGNGLAIAQNRHSNVPLFCRVWELTSSCYVLVQGESEVNVLYRWGETKETTTVCVKSFCSLHFVEFFSKRNGQKSVFEIRTPFWKVVSLDHVLAGSGVRIAFWLFKSGHPLVKSTHRWSVNHHFPRTTLKRSWSGDVSHPQFATNPEDEAHPRR